MFIKGVQWGKNQREGKSDVMMRVNIKHVLNLD